MLGVVLPLLLVIIVVVAALAYFRFHRRYTCRKQEEQEEEMDIEPDNLIYSTVSDVPDSSVNIRQESGVNRSCLESSIR